MNGWGGLCFGGRGDGTLAAGGGAAWPASSCAVAHRRGPLPAAPMPRTPPQHTPRRNVPWVMRSASWPARPSRGRCADCRTKGHSTGPERRALSGLAPPVSTVLRIPLRGTRLRRTLDPGDLCQPSGPDGKGQARGPARSAQRTSQSASSAGNKGSPRSGLQEQDDNLGMAIPA